MNFLEKKNFLYLKSSKYYGLPLEIYFYKDSIL